MVRKKLMQSSCSHALILHVQIQSFNVKVRFVNQNFYRKKPNENYKVQGVFLILFYLAFIL